jgi:uncharacterized protein YdaT
MESKAVEVNKNNNKEEVDEMEDETFSEDPESDENGEGDENADAEKDHKTKISESEK